MKQMAVSGRFLPQWGPGLCTKKSSPGPALLCVWPWDQALLGERLPAASSQGSLPRAAAHTPLTGQMLTAPCSMSGRPLLPAEPWGSSRLDFVAGGPRLGSAPTPDGEARPVPRAASP